MEKPFPVAASAFWIIGNDKTRAWSSAAVAYVSKFDAADALTISSEEALREVLTYAGCPERAPGYVPQEVAMWQARAAMRDAGVFDKVAAAVAASGNSAVQAAWEYATAFNRSSPSVQAMWAALGESPESLDTLFIAAAKIKV